MNCIVSDYKAISPSPMLRGWGRHEEMRNCAANPNQASKPIHVNEPALQCAFQRGDFAGILRRQVMRFARVMR